MKRLVIAPHCDDETLGCGGLLAKYPGETGVVVVARPDSLRAKEFAAAQEVLGYELAAFLDLPDGDVGGDMAGLVRLLDVVMTEYRPEQLYLPFPSVHQDHISVYEAGVRSARLSMNPHHHYPAEVLIYDVAAYDLELYPSDLRWNVFEALTEEHAQKKADALHAYGSQMVTGPHPVNGIKEGARTLGLSRRVEYAEKYALMRQVRL